VVEYVTSAGGSKTKEYVYGSNGVDDVIASLENNTLTYYHKNQLGSIVALSDATGNIIEQYRYDVFGKPYIRDIATNTWKEFTSSLVGNDRLFTGREYNAEVNLYYYRARHYDATLGRFISRDPIGIKDDINLYAYVKNNPVNAVDPMGLASKAVLQIFKNAHKDVEDILDRYDTA